jgi:iron complex outermembrane receptor protein
VLPGFSTIDTYLGYVRPLERARLTLQLNVRNLLDRRYFLNSNVYDASPRLGIMPGEPRAVAASARLEF